MRIERTLERHCTLLHFVGDPEQLNLVGRKAALKLKDLTKLTNLNGQTFALLPTSVQLQFLLRPLKVTTLNDRSDLNVRYELFERLNTGGVKLHPQEIRNCIFRGPLRGQLKTLASETHFRKVVIMRTNEQAQALYEECVLRFFAFLERYQMFGHLVTRFLTDFSKDRNDKGIEPANVKLFHQTMKFIASELPQGIVRSMTSTPLNLYEAISVGTALCFLSGNAPKTGELAKLLRDPKLNRFTSGGTNSRPMVVGRIEYVRDALT
jgi:hypothetical protein